MKFDLFKKQSHYLWLVFWLVLCHGFYMSYIFPHDWAESANATAFIDAVAEVVPALHGLKAHVPSYTSYWGMFYATFWCLSPVFFVIGFASTFFYKKENYEKIKLNKARVHIVAFLFFFVVWLIPFFLPFIGNFPNPLFNQMSSFFPFRVLAWLITGSLTFALGLTTGCCYQRLVVDKKLREQK